MGLPIKHIRWLANQADNVVPSADDLKRFGPQAARVRALLDFLPKMSDDAARVSGSAYNSVEDADALYAVYDAARRATSDAERVVERHAASHDARDLYYGAAPKAAQGAAYDAAGGVAIGDLISPEHYRILTNPLAAGRAVDILGNRPRNQGLPFYDIVRQLGDSGILRTPRDVVAASRLAKLPNNVLETALTMLTDPDGTYTLQDLNGLLSSARLLG